MIDLLPTLPPPAATPTPVVAKASATSGRFEQTLGAFLDARDARGQAQPAKERHDAAADGKDLPADPDTDATADDQTDAAMVPTWLPTLPIPLPTPAPALPIPVAAVPAVALPSLASVTPPLPVADIVQTAPPAPVKATATTAPPPAPTLDGLIAEALDRAGASPAKPTLCASAPVALAQIDSAPAIAVSTTPQPAGQVFAAAIAAATSWRDDKQGAHDPTDASAALGIAAPLQLDSAAVQATGDANHSALDLTRDPGLQRMIDRIETLRGDASDGADSRDTRIRLVPDALGSVDVAVRQEGAHVHVSFTTQHETTRALIAEAQPRLTELAAARGVKIGDTSVSADTSGGGSALTPQPRPVAQRAPAPVMPAETELSTDHRLA